MEEERLIASMREFNRFYARVLGAFDQYALGTSYSLAQARILGELGRNRGCTANSMAVYLDMDRSYVARIVAGFEKNGLLEKRGTAEDSRKKCLWLTAEGEKLYQEFEEKSDDKIRNQLQGVDASKWSCLEQAMQQIHRILSEADTDGRH